jgi:predicted rRNA methylase YqxC with S4 and FtsJ domains
LAQAVKINETYPDKVGTPVPVDAEINIKSEDNYYVSRGDLKIKLLRRKQQGA